MSRSTTVYVKVSRADGSSRTRLFADNKFTIEGGGSTVNVTAVGAGNRTRWACFQAAANKFSGQFAHVSNGFQLDNNDKTTDFVLIP